MIQTNNEVYMTVAEFEALDVWDDDVVVQAGMSGVLKLRSGDWQYCEGYTLGPDGEGREQIEIRSYDIYIVPAESCSWERLQPFPRYAIDWGQA